MHPTYVRRVGREATPALVRITGLGLNLGLQPTTSPQLHRPWPSYNGHPRSPRSSPARAPLTFNYCTAIISRATLSHLMTCPSASPSIPAELPRVQCSPSNFTAHPAHNLARRLSKSEPVTRQEVPHSAFKRLCCAAFP